MCRGSSWAKGEYGYEHNWSEDREGRGVLDQEALAGSPDLQAWLRDRRDALASPLEECSSDNLAKLERTTNTLFQSEPAGRGGGFDPSRLAILLNEETDLSTFAHEAGHFNLTVLSALAKDDNAPEVANSFPASTESALSQSMLGL